MKDLEYKLLKRLRRLYKKMWEYVNKTWNPDIMNNSPHPYFHLANHMNLVISNLEKKRGDINE